MLFGLILYGLLYIPLIWTNVKGNKGECDAAEGGQEPVPCTLVIPFHNEESRLPGLLESISRLQPQPSEVILVNDHSTDHGMELVHILKRDLSLHKLRVLENPDIRGKKRALTHGIQSSSFDVILTSDADCLFPSAWVGELFQQFTNTGLKFLFGLVDYQGNGKWLEKYQKMESRALMSTGVALFNRGIPVMCNGANLMFSKTSWESVGGYTAKLNVMGGDDIFLLHAIYRVNPDRVGYSLCPNTVVKTRSVNRFSAFMKQRRRWMSKTGKYDFFLANVFPFLVGAVNLLVLVSLVLGLIDGRFWQSALLILGKACIDWGMVNGLSRSFNSRFTLFRIIAFLPFQMIYPFLLGFYTPDWKADPSPTTGSE